MRQYEVAVVGRVEAIRERFYALSAERRLRHPGVVAIAGAARDGLFEEEGAAAGDQGGGSDPSPTSP